MHGGPFDEEPFAREQRDPEALAALARWTLDELLYPNPVPCARIFHGSGRALSTDVAADGIEGLEELVAGRLARVVVMVEVDPAAALVSAAAVSPGVVLAWRGEVAFDGRDSRLLSWDTAPPTPRARAVRRLLTDVRARGRAGLVSHLRDQGTSPAVGQPTPGRPIVAEFLIAAGPTAPAAARNAIGGLAGALPPEVRDVLRLIASELVTYGVLNARGAGAPLLLRVARHPGGTRLEISSSHGAPADADGAWTLGRDRNARFRRDLITGIAGRWGVDMRDGPVVWVEIDDEDEQGA